MEMVKGERWITWIIRISGYSSILFVSLILIFLAREGLPALGKVPLGDLFGTRWYPIESYFGIWPLIFGSILVTVGALPIGIPFGMDSGIFRSWRLPDQNILARLKFWRAAIGGFGFFRHSAGGTVIP
jgi:ABC-type phosphate transport system permease subunit